MTTSHVRHPLAAALLAWVAACAGGGVVEPRAGSGTTVPVSTSPSGVHPGFDIGVYPGDAAVRAWTAPASPYEWIGYYLPAPCHRDVSFVGRRATVAAAGFGVAVLYVGQQTWDGLQSLAPRESPSADAAPSTLGAEAARTAALRAMAPLVTCSRTLLDAAQGDTEGADAVTQTAAEGFPAGTIIFLDLEPMQVVTAAMKSYYRAWIVRVVADGRYRPGIYAHVRNAAELHADAMDAAQRAGLRDDVPFWVASTSGFSLRSMPNAVGFAFATAWQGALDVSRTWSGVTLRVDESVADRRSPSAP